MPKNIWYNIFGEFVGELKDDKSDIVDKIKSLNKLLKSNSSTENIKNIGNKLYKMYSNLNDTSKKLDHYKYLMGNKQGVNNFKVIDSSHNFRKYEGR